MKKVALAKASEPLSKYAAELDEEIVVLTVGGRPVAALVPLHNVDRESLALSSHPEFLGLVDKSRAEVAGGSTLTADQIREELHLPAPSDRRARARRPMAAPRRGRR